ncbi:hypothetical protein [Streptomyces sp. NBC_01431]|uniref:hypothetical protein n=1 Tax=Streptomyces sp. NBC_01431 TaxID=2903863 RepID=UPI002E322EAA|nr:hypothetical protein [Streptomyces sp. NBC_01431]
MGVVVTADAALAAGYLLGRLRPWQRAGDWAADQARFTGTWVRGDSGRQAVAVRPMSWLEQRVPGLRGGRAAVLEILSSLSRKWLIPWLSRSGVGSVNRKRCSTRPPSR